MTRLRNIVLGGIAALAIGGVAGSAQAMETGTFQNRLNGATIGLPLGALPPAGLYTGLETAYLGPLAGSGNSGASIGNQCARLASGALRRATGNRSSGAFALGAGLEFPRCHLRRLGRSSLL